MKFDDKKQKERLEEFRLKEEEDLVQILSQRYNVPYVKLSTASISGDALKLVDEHIAREAGLAVFGLKGKNIQIAVISPKQDKVKAVIDDLNRKSYKETIFMASKESLEKAWDRYKEVSFATKTKSGVFDISGEEVSALANQMNEIADLKKLLDETIGSSERYKISRILEVMLAGAISLHASDIHMETEDKSVRLRFRFDGVLQDMASFDHKTYAFLLSRMKLLSGLKLNIKQNAQDGRFSIKMEIGEIEIRTSIIPGGYGESIVMRVLNPEAISLPFEELGMDPVLFEVLKKEITRPNGMILTTGPTGSGKTTTLYAILRKVYTPEVKVITIEDPIEYHLKGVSQTQVNKEKGYTFLEGLRSSLRQDPDIIMVGEIRDSETASVAVNSALTGHLVLSTLHTNNAAGVIPRLIDLGVNPKIISSALNISLAQRLVRKLCNACKQKAVPTEKELATINVVLEGIKKKRKITANTSTIYRAQEGPNNTCPLCGGAGYKGRIGVYEGILTDEEVEKVIVTENPSDREIKKAAEGQDILTMREDGIMKVLAGTTSLGELRRVVDIEEG